MNRLFKKSGNEYTLVIGAWLLIFIAFILFLLNVMLSGFMAIILEIAATVLLFSGSFILLKKLFGKQFGSQTASKKPIANFMWISILIVALLLILFFIGLFFVSLLH